MAVVAEHVPTRPPDLSADDLVVWERLSEELAGLQQEKRLMRQVVTAEILRIVTETHELAVQLSSLEDELSIYNDDIANLKIRKTEFSTTVENNSRLHRQMAQALEANAAARRLAQDAELKLAKLSSSASSDFSSSAVSSSSSELSSSTSSESLSLTPSTSTSSGLSDAQSSNPSSSSSSTWTHPSTPNSPAPSGVLSGGARSAGTRRSPRLSPRLEGASEPQSDFRRLRSKTEEVLSEAGSHLDTDSYVRRQAEEFEKIIQDIRNSLKPIRKPS